MNKTETLAAAEIMRRAAEGEVVECRKKQPLSQWTHFYQDFIAWDWQHADYRILDFPAPPPNTQWHNPANLNATQVGVHEGWRLCLEGEITPMGLAHTLEVRMGSGWTSWRLELAKSYNTFRTKSPLPEVKADPMAVAVAWSSYSIGKKTPEYAQAWADFIGGWKACKEHYKIP